MIDFNASNDHFPFHTPNTLENSMPLSVGQRTTKVQQRLLAIRIGPGAVRLPHNVKRINLRFAPKAEGGHLGAR